jgi:protein-tyrosine phosphatase
VRTDLHFHLLPGLDDGPTSYEESAALARASVDDGTTTIVATPHVREDHVTDVRDLPDRARELGSRLAADGIRVRVQSGGELGHEMVGSLDQDDLESIAVGPPGSRWLLVECPFEGLEEGFHAATQELRERGFEVILAHPERSAGILDDRRSSLDLELAEGSLMLVNALSLAGGYGPAARRAATTLVRSGLASALASDAHGPHRPAALTAGERCVVSAGVGADVARRLTVDTPAALLHHGLARVAVTAALAAVR